MNKPMMPYMIGKFIDEDVHTVHVLKGKAYLLLATFSINQKEQIIEKIKADYPLVADKLKNYKGGTL